MTKVTPIGAVNNDGVPHNAPVIQHDETIVIVLNGKTTKPEQKKEFNVYGDDIANFENFKKDDRHDAMRQTTAYAADVKRAYMQLQHDFPDVNLEFETMPDPKKSGKKREGFITYQQKLEIWKNSAIAQIDNARELCTADKIEEEGAKTRATVVAAAEAVAENDDINTAIVLQEQDENTAELKKEVKNDGAATRATVKKEEAKTRTAVHVEGAVTRAVVAAEGAITRATNHLEHEQTRKVVERTADETQQAVHHEGIETRSRVIEEHVGTRKVVREEGKKTRDKVQESIEIEDPTGLKRLRHKTKKLFNIPTALSVAGASVAGGAVVAGQKLAEKVVGNE